MDTFPEIKIFQLKQTNKQIKCTSVYHCKVLRRWKTFNPGSIVLLFTASLFKTVPKGCGEKIRCRETQKRWLGISHRHATFMWSVKLYLLSLFKSEVHLTVSALYGSNLIPNGTKIQFMQMAGSLQKLFLQQSRCLTIRPYGFIDTVFPWEFLKTQIIHYFHHLLCVRWGKGIYTTATLWMQVAFDAERGGSCRETHTEQHSGISAEEEEPATKGCSVDRLHWGF